MNWNLRYANSKIPSKCVFCNGSSHLFRSAVDNSKKGLPRPLVDNSDEGSQLGVPGTRFPLPWSVSIKNPNEEPSITNISFQEKQIPVVKENLCPMCGEGFKDDEPAVRAQVEKGHPWEQINSLYISGAPFHPKCMQTTRRFCPVMSRFPDEHFEHGTAEELINNYKRWTYVNPIPRWLPKD